MLRTLVARGAFDRELSRKTITRQQFLRINHLAFRGGSFFPVVPDGPHVGLARPFWIVQNVTGVDAGIWYFHPPSNQWSILRRGSFRMETAYMCGEELSCGNGAAVCLITSNLKILTRQGGPDLYRLAHLEAGIVSERLCRAAAAFELGGRSVMTFFDDEIRKFCGLDKSGWEVLEVVAIGVPMVAGVQEVVVVDDDDEDVSDGDWRG
jgi:SagB-type dehydrogenase family enzyme